MRRRGHINHSRSEGWVCHGNAEGGKHREPRLAKHSAAVTASRRRSPPDRRFRRALTGGRLKLMHPRRNDMTYIDGFVAPVLQENKQAYLHHAHEALSLGRPKWSQLPSSCLTRRWRKTASNPRSPLSGGFMQTPRSPPIASTGGRRCTLRSSPTASSTSWSERLAIDLALFDSTRLVGPCATGHPDRMKAAAAEYVRAGASHHPNYPTVTGRPIAPASRS
jgi:hypothetical protein